MSRSSRLRAKRKRQRERRRALVKVQGGETSDVPCIECPNGKWKWGETGECRYSSREECEKAHAGHPHLKGRSDMSDDQFTTDASVIKVDEELGLVLGFAIVSKIDGKKYFDLQGDHIPEDSMLKAAVDFMENSRLADEMHAYEKRGTVVFAFPLTTDIAKAFGIETKMTGLMIAMRPDEAMLEKFKSGELTGFSIGGKRIRDEEVTAA